MRRACLRVVQQAGATSNARGSAQQWESVSATPALVRSMGGDAHPETPLSKIMPAVAALPRQAVSTAVGLTGSLAMGLASSGMAKSMVNSFASKLVVEEAIVNIQDLDPSYWTYWLSAIGYNNTAGFKKLADAAKAKVAHMSPEQITNLITGLHGVHFYDKELFEVVSANISANFTKFDTEQLLSIVKAFADNDHFSVALFDDIADSITYCNHYLAPVKLPTSALVDGLAAYAKFGHDRGDLFVALTRGISELGLSKLSAKARRDAVASGLKSLSILGFYPEQVDALLYYAKTEASEYSAEELKLAETVTAAVEAQTGGSLQTYEPNEEDATHWYGHHQAAAQSYELYVFRDALVPESYSPVSSKK